VRSPFANAAAARATRQAFVQLFAKHFGGVPSQHFGARD
jgi:hypothetical protein